MILTPNHQKLDIYQASISFVFECYKLSRALPVEEKFGMIRRAALSVHLNIAEGASRKSEAERKRYYEVAQGPVIEIEAPLHAADMLDYLNNIDTKQLVNCWSSAFAS